MACGWDNSNQPGMFCNPSVVLLTFADTNRLWINIVQSQSYEVPLEISCIPLRPAPLCLFVPAGLRISLNAGLHRQSFNRKAGNRS